MSRRLRLLSLPLVALIWALMSVPGVAAPAATSTPEDLPPADDPVVSFLAADQHVPIAEAQWRALWLQRSTDLAPELSDALGRRFGGLWSDPKDGNRLKVGIVGSDAGLATAVARHGLSEAVDEIQVRFSLADLEAADAFIESGLAAANQGAEWPFMTSVRTDLNRLVLQFTMGKPLTEAQEGFLADLERRYPDLLLVVPSEGRQTITPDSCVFPSCDAPLRGGILIDNDQYTGTQQYCTAGFNARSVSDAKWYLLTAGHCAFTVGGGTWASPQPDLGGWHSIGPFHNAQWGPRDAGILRIDNVSYWDPRNWVMVYDSPCCPSTTRDAHYYINGDVGYASQNVGLAVCKTGATGATDCGYITAKGNDSTFGGHTVIDTILTNYCSYTGDSGSPIYKLHLAYGLHHGHASSNCVSAYQTIREAEAAMNVNVFLN